MRVVIVRGGQNFLARFERQSMVDERQTGGGAARQRDLFHSAAEVGGDVFLHFSSEAHEWRFEFEHPLLDGQKRVPVGRAAKSSDPVTDRVRMGKGAKPCTVHDLVTWAN